MQIHQTTFDDFKRLFSNRGICVDNLQSPYKICDYRPAFWVLKDELGTSAESSYWGHCDLDVVFGDVCGPIEFGISSRFFKIFTNGHLSLYRDCALTREISQLDGRIRWSEVIGTPTNLGFDECHGINCVYRTLGVPMLFGADRIIDLYPGYSEPTTGRVSQNRFDQRFLVRDGRIIQQFRGLTGRSEREFYYLHFQKRKMDIDVGLNPLEPFFIGSRGAVQSHTVSRRRREITGPSIRAIFDRGYVLNNLRWRVEESQFEWRMSNE